MPVLAENQERKLRVYPEERSEFDKVGEEGFLERAINEFGLRVARGTALTFHHLDGKRYNFETLFREYAKGHKRCIEIGTFRGVSTAVLAHYCEKVMTIDIKIFEEAMSLWKFFGVEEKIVYSCVDSDASKAQAIEDFGEFDFAFIDGMHTYECVEYDFSLVKKCGNVLFHDYGCSIGDFGIKRFVDTLPAHELWIQEPFALWKQQG